MVSHKRRRNGLFALPISFSAVFLPTFFLCVFVLLCEPFLSSLSSGCYFRVSSAFHPWLPELRICRRASYAATATLTDRFRLRAIGSMGMRAAIGGRIEQRPRQPALLRRTPTHRRAKIARRYSRSPPSSRRTSKVGRAGGGTRPANRRPPPNQVLPIVQARPAEMAIVEPEAQGPNQPKLGPQGDAGAADVARVVGNLRLMQNDMQQGRRP